MPRDKYTFKTGAKRNAKNAWKAKTVIISSGRHQEELQSFVTPHPAWLSSSTSHCYEEWPVAWVVSGEKCWWLPCCMLLQHCGFLARAHSHVLLCRWQRVLRCSSHPGSTLPAWTPSRLTALLQCMQEQWAKVLFWLKHSMDALYRLTFLCKLLTRCTLVQVFPQQCSLNNCSRKV